MTEHITRLLVWSRWLRITHWTLALCTLILLTTGWLMKSFPDQNSTASDVHFVASSLLIAALAVRFWMLLFGRSNEQWGALVPDPHRMKQAGEVLAFYLSLGKSPLPKWYTHNPLWGPLYLLLFFLVLLQIISGLLLLDDTTLLVGISVRHLHELGNTFILWFTLLHLVSSFTHDASNQSADVSAMINGHRFFFVEEKPEQQAEYKSVSLEELKSKLPSKRNQN